MQQQRISTLASNLITSIRKKARLKFLSVLVAGSALVLPLTAFSQNLGSDGITCNEPDLAAALATVGAGGTVYVPNGTQNIDVWGTTVVPEDVTLQGTDSTCTAGSVGTGTLEYTAAGRILEVDPDVHLILIDVVLLGGDSTGNGGTVWLDDDATLAMFDSVLESGVSGGNGGCLAIEGGSLSMFGDSAIRNCVAENDGGGVWSYFDAYVWVFDGSTIAFNTATNGDGGNLYQDGGTISVKGLIEGGNAPNGNGGGIALIESVGYEPYLVISDSGNVRNNIAGIDGGGIFVDVQYLGASDGDGLGPEVLLTDDAFLGGNEAEDDGGGLWVSSHYSLVTIEDNTTISLNVAGDNGGGIWYEDGNLELFGDAWIVWNFADGNGGGLWAQDVTATVAGSAGGVEFTLNYADGNGGGLNLDRTVLTGSSLQLHLNQAVTGNGGGARLRGGSEVVLSNTTAADNFALEDGGAWLVAEESSLELDADFATCTSAVGTYCSLLEDNNADEGGAIAVKGGSTADVKYTHFLDNGATTNGGAVHVRGPASQVNVKNTLVEANGSTAAVFAFTGTIDVRSSTLVNNTTPFEVDVGATGVFHRNVVASNTNDAVMTGAVTGNCNVTQTLAGAPTGANNDVGTPTLDANWLPASNTEALIVDACGAGPADDIIGTARPLGGSYDRGVFEAF